MKPLLETAVFGGGCFWCIEAMMESINGVVSVTSGYAGGTTQNPTYQQVCTATTGHAEVIKAEFNPSAISYARLLHIFMAMHNPTQRSAQEKKGGQYRSVIFYNSNGQKETAHVIIEEMQAYFDAPILTRAMPLTLFYEAETRHQGYYKNDPSKAYCQTVIAPKMNALRRQFFSHLKPAPVT